METKLDSTEKPTLSLNMLKYGWSKYGGANHGLVKEELDEWYCQCCGKKQTKILPSYMINLDDEREFYRICSNCKNVALNKKVANIKALIRVIRLRWF